MQKQRGFQFIFIAILVFFIGFMVVVVVIATNRTPGSARVNVSEMASLRQTDNE